jgi:hypothetical protein
MARTSRRATKRRISDATSPLWAPMRRLGFLPGKVGPPGTLGPPLTSLRIHRPEGPRGREASCHRQPLIGAGVAGPKPIRTPPSGSRFRSTTHVAIAAGSVLQSIKPPRSRAPRHELAAVHSITSSATASRFGGMVRPSALAVLRLMANFNLVACWTGKSPGFSPLRMRPTYWPARRNASE